MALNTSRCNHLMPLRFKGLNHHHQHQQHPSSLLAVCIQFAKHLNEKNKCLNENNSL